MYFSWQCPIQELPDRFADFAMMGLKREMSSIKEVNISIGIVAPESLGAGRQKEWIVLSPDREQRRLFRAEVVLKLRIKRHITGIVQEKIQLNFVIPRP